MNERSFIPACAGLSLPLSLMLANIIMKINTSLGKIQFEIELKAIEGSEQQSERNRLAALNIIAHSVGSKFRPESYSQENADKLESVLGEKLGKLFSVVNYSPSEWFAKETMSLSLKGMSAEFIAEMKKLVEAEKSKGKPKADPDVVVD